ncbi:MAG: hypothetical protein L7V34_05140 [Rhodobacteraceae bacterium]|jgi:hypothetical protein|nr:hypothetical protein [Paracoccaceae bacterium]
MWNRFAAVLVVVSLIGQGAFAQNILGQLLGLEQGVSREAAEQAELFPEVGEPAPEPSLAELINGEKSDYPELVSSSEYETRSECVLAISGIYDASLVEGVYAIPRMDFWLDRYIGQAREIYICDGSVLNAYFDDNNSVPVRWRMVRTSIDIILAELETDD